MCLLPLVFALVLGACSDSDGSNDDTSGDDLGSRNRTLPDATDDTGRDTAVSDVQDATNDVVDVTPDVVEEYEGQIDPETAGTDPNCPAGRDLVHVPAGAFLYDQAGTSVHLDAFCMDRMEVSAGLFNDCVAAGGCESYEGWDQCQNLNESSPIQCVPGFEEYPANYVDWYRAQQYCEWAGGWLPTEEEWEKAARGTDGRPFPWGWEWGCENGHFERGSTYPQCMDFGGLDNFAQPVDSYADYPSPYGTINQAGNVMEWIDFREDRTSAPRETYGKAKGGGWKFAADCDEALCCIGAYSAEGRLGPGISSEEHGFRCAFGPM